MMDVIRDLTNKAKDYLAKDDILLIIGPRQAGKTTVLHQIESFLKKRNDVCYFLNLEDPDYLSLLNKSPKNLFKIFPIDIKKRTFLFVDEVQYLDNPSNFLKYLFDEYKGKIKIIASGSSAFYLDKKFKDSLAGRKIIFNLLTLSFREFLKFKEQNELSEANFKNLTLSEKDKIIPFYQEYLIYGGYPRVVLSPLEGKREILRDIAYSYIKKDIYESNIRNDEIFYKLFKILSDQIGSLINNSELANTLDVSRSAIDNYLYVMQKSFHIVLIKPFYKNIRKELTKMPKIYFIDLGLRNFFKNDFRFYQQREDKGELLENVVLRHLLEKYLEEQINFWRTTQQREVDFIINNSLALEVKSQIKGVKVKNYKTFLENYPNIKLNFICLDCSGRKINSFSVLEPWQI
ncbi:MAG: ATP-binding protein [Candidatus Pacebacteria bacterium]|jgi:predicted AAA+ superfamily ATPase|nr:ATP-binding protein [Candidatus Paceibacterota bacterium]MDD4994780.1 ATP-binding protein [Candidatus Paceibacterota bacterium]MDD5535510.1 ATP-binding protein [Candidatus Paceibacterota bacterium]